MIEGLQGAPGSGKIQSEQVRASASVADIRLATDPSGAICPAAAK
ncbi:MAG: hypothetical protein WC804_02245 [Sphingomonas sp.]|jgi:hypothetical protein